MSVLKQKLDKAAQQFRTHNFKQALTLYEDCLAFCNRTRETPATIYNIMTTKAALFTIMGDLDKAAATLSEVIKNDSTHYLALIRRSQLYKKRGKLNRALRDLETVSAFCPDNLQIVAMRIEIQNLRSKSKPETSSEQSDSEQDEVDQQPVLNFGNLKKIDRKSCSNALDDNKQNTIKGRRSRVTILGTTAVEYEREDDVSKSLHSSQIKPEQLKEKYVRTSRQIQMEKDVAAPANKIVAKNNFRSKSILKNKINFGGPTQQQEEAKDVIPVREVRDSKLIDKLKNIEGKVLKANTFLEQDDQNQNQAQIQISVLSPKDKLLANSAQKNANKSGRKSCLKNSIFQALQPKQDQQPAKRSKFETLSRKSIDGVLIKKRKSIDDIELGGVNGKIEEVDSDEGSSYNIFGSNQNLMISKEMKQKLGITQDDNKQPKVPKPRQSQGKSILKKNSVLVQSLPTEQTNRSEVNEIKTAKEEQVIKKPKKSVMFTKSRFAAD